MVSPEAAVVPVTAAASAVSGLVANTIGSGASAVIAASGRAVMAASEAEERTGSWFPWLAGFLPGVLVVGVAYLVLRYLRRRDR